MKTANLLIASVATLVAPWVQAEAIVSTPRTVASANAVQSSAKVQHALARFIAGCTTHDARILDSVTTDDVRIEYSLDVPGTYLTLDAISLSTDCGINVGSGASRISSMRIYPTSDADAVFVEFELTNDASMVPLQRQLVLVEMRGEKIARLLSFSPPANTVVSAKQTVSPSPTVRAASREATTGSE